jgi:hypothetical protein
VTLTREEQKRLVVVVELHARRIKAREAAFVLGLSVRQARRLLVSCRLEFGTR